MKKWITRGTFIRNFVLLLYWQLTKLVLVSHITQDRLGNWFATVYITKIEWIKYIYLVIKITQTSKFILESSFHYMKVDEKN